MLRKNIFKEVPCKNLSDDILWYVYLVDIDIASRRKGDQYRVLTTIASAAEGLCNYIYHKVRQPVFFEQDKKYPHQLSLLHYW